MQKHIEHQGVFKKYFHPNIFFLIFLNFRDLQMFLHHSNKNSLLPTSPRKAQLHTKVLFKNYITSTSCSMQMSTEILVAELTDAKEIEVIKSIKLRQKISVY